MNDRATRHAENSHPATGVSDAARRVRGWAVVAFVTGCGAPALPSDAAPETGTGSTTASSTSGQTSIANSATSAVDPESSGTTSNASSGSSSGVASDSGSTGQACDPRWCDIQCPDVCEATISCDVIVQCGCDCPNHCDIEEVAAGLADQSDTMPEDCGVVTPNDDLSMWEALRACVIDNSANEVAFKAVFHLVGIDSTYSDAFVGRAGGGTYTISALSQHHSIPGVTTVYQRICSALAEVQGCAVGFDDECIECVDATDEEPICGP